MGKRKTSAEILNSVFDSADQRLKAKYKTEDEVLNLVFDSQSGRLKVNLDGVAAAGNTPYSNPLEAYASADPAGSLRGGVLLAPGIGSLAIKYYGGALENGKIYFAPRRAVQVLCINTSDDTIELIGNYPENINKWFGAVAGGNGKVYFVPFAHGSVLVLNTADNSTALIPTGESGSSKWTTGVLAPNGKIYCAPSGLAKILVIDTSNDSVYVIDVSINNCNASVLASDGKVHFISRDGSVLVLDPADDSLSSYSIPIHTIVAAALAPNGRIYSYYSGNQLLVIDPVGRNGYTVTLDAYHSGDYGSALLAPDGKIYCPPNNSSKIAVIDPQTETVEFFGSFGSGGNLYQGAVLAPNGSIYCVPRNATRVLKIPHGAHGNQWWALSPFVNRS